jgi:hypothetical protein
MLLTSGSHYLFFASGNGINHPKQIHKFSVNKKKIVAKFEDAVFEKGIHSMAISPDSNSLYVGTINELVQFSLKDAKIIQSRKINERTDMNGATIYAMKVTRNNQYLVTATAYVGKPKKGTKKDLSGQENGPVAGPLCVWSTKDLTLVKA